MRRPICGSLALQKLDLIENFAVTDFSTKSVLHCIHKSQNRTGHRNKNGDQFQRCVEASGKYPKFLHFNRMASFLDSLLLILVETHHVTCNYE